MTKYPYPIDASGVSLDRYLTNLLSALVQKAGGRLAISVSDILKVQDQVLLRYPSRNMQEIMLQLAPRNTDMYVVPEAPPWVQSPQPVRPPVKTAERIPPPPPAPVANPSQPIHSTLDNLSLYLKEQEREEKLREIQEQDEMEERRRVGLSPFRTIPGK